MAGLKENIKKIFKKYAFKPEYDSDGGSDYVDGVDDLQAAKFNHRWNGEDEIMQDLQNYIEVLHSILKTTHTIGYFYEDPDSPFCKETEAPFQIVTRAGELEYMIFGNASAAFTISEDDEVLLPLTAFHDLIRKGDEQFAIVVGNTNLFEIQNDYPTSSKKWYRLGHDGAEGSPAAVTVRHIITQTAGNMWFNGDVKFHDYMNNPTGGTQVIRFDSIGKNGEFFELILDNAYTNYHMSYAVWNGSSLDTVTDSDTAIARSIGEHQLSLYCYKAYTRVDIDGSLAMYEAAKTIQFIDELEFTSNNATGSADYFDILRFNMYINYYTTPATDQTDHIFIARMAGSAYCWLDRSYTASNMSAGIGLYAIRVPSGATEIEDEYIADLRNLQNFWQNPRFPTLKVDGALSVDGGNITVSGGYYDGGGGVAFASEWLTNGVGSGSFTIAAQTTQQDGSYIRLNGPTHTTANEVAIIAKSGVIKFGTRPTLEDIKMLLSTTELTLSGINLFMDASNYIKFGSGGYLRHNSITAEATGTSDSFDVYVNSTFGNGAFIQIHGPNYTSTPDEFEMATKSTGRFVWGKYDSSSHFMELNATGLVVFGLGWTEIRVDNTAGSTGLVQIRLNSDDDTLITFEEGGSNRVNQRYDVDNDKFFIDMVVETEPIEFKYNGNTYFTFDTNGFKTAATKSITFGVFTDANRGAAGNAGRVIFNTTDGNLNIDNGTNWILPDGTTT